MRIISGKNKGKKLEYPDTALNVTRPTRDFVKEAIFNLIQGYDYNTIALDLFAGSGQLGLECLSRDAMKVIFNDIDKIAVEIIKKNVSSINARNAEVYMLDYKELLEKQRNSRFDLIFLDPPYQKDEMYDYAINFINDNNMLSNKGMIIVEGSLTHKLNIPDDLIIYKSKTYGKSIIIILSKK